ncbi:endoribonuclease L-PSP [Actinoplanes sp. SE50]|uniref:RidA family protein n=1 Tax=unclassified Actinoplanes TaxID=2626549 RepID=UPI00023ED0A6|nr:MULTISPECIES: RidA family protein [unclassified Actinoplanes]AEV84936.1 endoribonuclease L-PSP [Actinoplanes sp. SE50/110]ATO83327.1 endoribonuclease L-PSP [Actinoplanes sp. SE50]SLM00734.1 hypothetical protein ACSP50_3967 [Actinoplanes sp. SE50/110]
MRVSLDSPLPTPFADRFADVARVDLPGGALLTLAGQVAVDDTGTVIAPGDAGAQAVRIFEIIGGLLAAHGAGLADILHIRTYLTDFQDLPAYAVVRRRLFPQNPPASTTVQVSALFLAEARLEVEVTAAIARPAAG